MIETYSDEDKRLVRYLFNELDIEEVRELEDEMLVDEELANRAEVVEMNLIDCYVRNELTAAENLRFRERFLVDPEKREKVDRALLFHESLRLLPENGQVVPNHPGWRRTAFFFFTRPLPVLALITTVVLVIAALIVFEMRRHAPNKNRLATNSASPETENQNANSPNSIDTNSRAVLKKDPAVDLAKNDPDKSTQYEYIHRQDWNGSERGGDIVHFVLKPPAKNVGLIYELAGDKASQRATYGIRIKNQYGERVWPQKKPEEEIKPIFRKATKQKLIIVKVPNKVFTDPGPYLLEFNDQYLPAKQFTVKR